MNLDGFRQELTELINKYSLENGSDTPDFILAEYLITCLLAFNTIVQSRTQWYGENKVEKVSNPITGIDSTKINKG